MLEQPGADVQRIDRVGRLHPQLPGLHAFGKEAEGNDDDDEGVVRTHYEVLVAGGCCAIFAQLSRRVTMRFSTGVAAVESVSGKNIRSVPVAMPVAG